MTSVRAEMATLHDGVLSQQALSERLGNGKSIERRGKFYLLHVKGHFTLYKLEQELSTCWDERPLDHNRHGPKSWGLLCPLRGGLGPHLTQCGLGQGLTPYRVASWSSQRLATIHQRYRQTHRTESTTVP